jgi:hypothetical protein
MRTDEHADTNMRLATVPACLHMPYLLLLTFMDTRAVVITDFLSYSDPFYLVTVPDHTWRTIMDGGSVSPSRAFYLVTVPDHTRRAIMDGGSVSPSTAFYLVTVPDHTWRAIMDGGSVRPSKALYLPTRNTQSEWRQTHASDRAAVVTLQNINTPS